MFLGWDSLLNIYVYIYIYEQALKNSNIFSTSLLKKSTTYCTYFIFMFIFIYMNCPVTFPKKPKDMPKNVMGPRRGGLPS